MGVEYLEGGDVVHHEAMPVGEFVLDTGQRVFQCLHGAKPTFA